MVRMKAWVLVAASIGCIWCAPDGARANFVVNGSFENVQIGSPYVTSDPTKIPGWTHSGSIGDGLMWGVGYSDGGGNITTAGDGRQFVTLGGGFFGTGTGHWSQTLTGLTVSSVYSLSFEMASEGLFSGSQSMTVDFTAGSSTSAQTFSAAPSSANYWRDWETKTMTFVADSSSVTLRFGATTQYDVGLDNVIVNPTAVPEPSTLVLTCLGGLTTLLVTSRRRRARNA